MRVATYNIHSCRGRDGRADPHRTAAVLDELDADVIGLQEVESCRRRVPDLDGFGFFERLEGWHFVPGVAIEDGAARYGNGLLSRTKPTVAAVHALPAGGIEPRCLIEAEVRGVRFLVTHLSLAPRARRTQIGWIAGRVGGRRAVALGDFNEWNPFSRRLRPLGALAAPRTGATWPARRPLLRLDRLFGVTSAQVHDSPLARMASDHLPVVGLVPDDGPAPEARAERG